ncbi:hypothetical protein L195_g028208 [Trifolium pratense]|uniref:Uncharacterized protein n=1 Tax=Trifolium pratense TaxID=57577 RepID=A0A2K3L1C2_TRIPR|nr:hypothetical protein L195_g028208 [Trifolium pratense]
MKKEVRLLGTAGGDPKSSSSSSIKWARHSQSHTHAYRKGKERVACIATQRNAKPP